MQVKGRAAVFAVVIGGWMAVTLSSVQTSARQTQPGAAPAGAMSSTAIKAVLDKYCITCHNQRLRTGGLALDDVDAARPAVRADVWERVIAKLRARSMPPAGMPRPDAATYHAVASSLEAEHRSGMGGEPEPGPDQRRPSPQSRGIQQRHPRSVRARRRRDVAAAGRRDGRRQLRQLRRRALDLDGAPRTLPVGGASGDAARGRPAAGDSRRRALRDSAARGAGRSAERRPAVRFARRHGDSLRLSRRRRVPDQGSSPQAVSGLRHGHGLAAAARRPPRWRAGEAVHRRRRRDGPARRGQLRRRRRAGLCRRPGVGKVHADRRGRRARGPPAGQRGPARRRRLVRQGAVGAGRPAAAAAAGQGADQRPDLHGLRERRRACRLPARTPVRGRRRTRRAAARSSSASPAASPTSATCAAKILSRIARLAYRRPATPADVQTLLEFFASGRREGGKLRRRDPVRARAGPRRSRLPAARVSRSRHARSRGVSAERSRSSPRGCRSSCGTAFPTSGCSTSPSAGS